MAYNIEQQGPPAVSTKHLKAQEPNSFLFQKDSLPFSRTPIHKTANLKVAQTSEKQSFQASAFNAHTKFCALILSHLLEDLAIGLHFIFLTEHLSGTKTVSLRKAFNCILKHFIQSSHSIMELCNKLLLAVDGPVRPCWIPSNLTPITARTESYIIIKAHFQEEQMK